MTQQGNDPRSRGTPQGAPRERRMETSIFRFLWRYSRRQQINLLILTLVSFPFLYYSLELPKIIINEAIGGSDFPREVLGWELEQIPFLLVLCAVFLLLVFVNGGFKYSINVYRGVVGERMLRRLRHDLFARVLRFPLPHFRKTSQGEIVSMITAETEPLGGFIGDAVALPAFQGGTLLTILIFMFMQDVVLGLAAVALYPLQAYLIPKLQRQVNELAKERTVRVRKLSERIGETVATVQEVHAHDTSRYELADISRRLGEIFHIRYQIYRKKFFIKFLNNFIAQVTPFFFYSIGGYLVIKGQLSFGAMVAVLAAYKDLSAPWKELLAYYQQQADAELKYELLRDMFEPPGLLPEESQTADPDAYPRLEGEVAAVNLDLREEDEDESVFAGNATFRFALGERVTITGSPTSGKDRLALILAGLKKPLGGRLTINGASLPELPETVIGRQIAYVGQEPRLRSGSVEDNLYYPLKHRPVRPVDYEGEAAREWEKWRREARLSGNVDYDLDADWIDYQALGLKDPNELTEKAIEALTLVDMDEGIYQLGLHGTVDPERDAELAARILEARAALRDRLKDPEIAPLVELFDKDRYNSNMSVAENLLFGTPRDDSFDIDNLAANPYVRKVLHEEDLMADFIETGRKLAEVMVDLFADVPPGSELFEQFSFIDAEDLPEFRNLLARTEPGQHEALSPEDRNRLLSLPFRLVTARHRLGLIDEAMEQRLLAARRTFARGFGEGAPEVEFFDPERYNPRISIQDNILFGRLAYGKARAAARIGALIREVVDKLGLARSVMKVGLDYPVGIGGTRLSGAQRQKLAIARCLLKQPRMLVLDEATAALDGASQATIMSNLLEAFRRESARGRGLIWVLHRASLGEQFDHVLVLEGGRVVAQGRFDEINQPGSVLGELVAAG